MNEEIPETIVTDCETTTNYTSKFAKLTYAQKQRYFDEIAIIFLENDKNDDGFLSKEEFESI